MGPAFVTINGEMMDYWKMNNMFVKELEEVQKEIKLLK
jgi:hypothetical protein